MLGNDRDLAALWDMAEAIREILADTRGLSLAEFQQRRVILRAVERNFEILGEAARRVSDEFRQQHPQINWRQMIGLRNIIIHRYESVDHEMLWGFAVQTLPNLLQIIEQWLPPLSD